MLDDLLAERVRGAIERTIDMALLNNQRAIQARETPADLLRRDQPLQQPPNLTGSYMPCQAGLNDAEFDPAFSLKINKTPSFRLHNNPPQVYNHIYYRWASFSVV